MRTLVVGGGAAVERLVARWLVRRGVAAQVLAAAADEAQLVHLPAPAWCESQEANMVVLARLKDERWSRTMAKIAAAEAVDPERFDRLLSQSFALGWGLKLAKIRMCLAVLDDPHIRLASDLPPALRGAFMAEFNGRVVPTRFASVILRTVSGTQTLARTLARHAVRIVRFVRLVSLPRKPSRVPSYVAWLGALRSEVTGSGPDKLSLTEFLAEARAATGMDEIVIQGASPTMSPSNIVHRPHTPPLRYRPRVSALLAAVVDQARLAISDVAEAFDFRRRTLVGPVLLELPALRLWFSVDPPRAVLYCNPSIGAEPPVALLSSAFRVPSMMVFYSANVCHRHPPSRPDGLSVELEPEQRFIAADRLTMWSKEMTQAYLAAGYPQERLVETGPVVFGRHQGFRPTSRFLTDHRGPLRIGIFDVSVFKPRRRFELGYGQLIYNPQYAEQFFRDILTAARERFGDGFVIVRKIKRALGPHHMDDVDFTRLPPATFVARDPDESLWRVLEVVDVVLCMPFTSVAHLADEYGIPAAYYDPSGTVAPSPLGGRAALLQSRAALDQWLAAPVCSVPRDPGELVGPKVIASAIGDGLIRGMNPMTNLED